MSPAQVSFKQDANLDSSDIQHVWRHDSCYLSKMRLFGLTENELKLDHMDVISFTDLQAQSLLSLTFLPMFLQSSLQLWYFL